MKNEYECPECVKKPGCPKNKVQPKLIDDECLGIHTYVLACRGCHREFGVPWTTRIHGISDLPTVLVGAEPWTDTEPKHAPKPLLTGALPKTYPLGWALIGRAVPSVILAAGSIMLLLRELVQKPTMV